MSRTVHVPLSVDSEVRVPLGPLVMPLRGVLVMMASLPIAFFCLTSIGGVIKWFIFFGVLFTAYTLSSPTREGLWFGTYFAYKVIGQFLPAVVISGRPQRAQVRLLGNTTQIHNRREPLAVERLPKVLHHVAAIPKVTNAVPGIFELKPGGARAILEVEGPTVPIGTDSYAAWADNFMGWLMTLDCPAQVLTVVSHFDSDKAQSAFDRRTAAWPRTVLLETERELAGNLAEASLGLLTYVILSPKSVERDGIPAACRINRLLQFKEVSYQDAERALESATRHAESRGLKVTMPDRDDIARLMSQTVIGASNATFGDGVYQVNDQHQVVVTINKLPPRVTPGVVVDALMRARSRGIASLHIYPVALEVARKSIDRQNAMHKYAQSQGTGGVDNDVAIADATNLLAAMAQRDIQPVRMAMTLAVSHNEREKALEAAERLTGLLVGDGFRVVTPTSPATLPSLAISPGWTPLARSLCMTTNTVAACLLPTMGTPFSSAQQPLVGLNALTGAPAYLSVWTRPNHNMVIVGSSGAGKSVTTKTLLIRHIMEGVSAVVIDPDSEYKSVMQAVGGQYYELGDDALNPFAAGMGCTPDTAASMVTPVLSVMAGDEKGLRDGRPIRRLPDEDQGWIHAQLTGFYRAWNARNPNAEPLMRHFVEYLNSVSQGKALTPREEERCHIITQRLVRFTQGRRALVFDRPSSFSVGQQPVGIGLKLFAMTYGADLTPALAVILTNILAAIEKRQGRMIVVVDEAHRVTSDPDAGEVLGQLVRQARKHGAGVWMASQKVEDFVDTDLGRTLSATAATKVVLGVEESVVDQAAEVFRLHPEEVRALNPISPGRGVILSGQERTVVHIVPGAAIMMLADTSSALRDAVTA